MPEPGVGEAIHQDNVSTETLANEEALAWMAIFGAWLSFGSFAVPMKWQSVVNAEVHPLVYQCYKTIWVFVTAHLVLVWQPYELSAWGIASGFSWVPAGVAAVVAVQHVGIACGQAVWQVTIIATSQVWGLLILRDEHFHHWWGALLSLFALGTGVMGMTLTFNLKPPAAKAVVAHDKATMIGKSLAQIEMSCLGAAEHDSSKTRTSAPQGAHAEDGYDDLAPLALSRGPPPRGAEQPMTHSPRAPGDCQAAADDGGDEGEDDKPADIAGKQTSAALGLGAAIFNGVWGGSNLVPQHFAPFHGIRFTLSFAWGALIANAALVLGYALVARFWWRCAMPLPHFRVMALPGFLSGTLWSLGNFFSLYAVSVLGQGLGASLIQSSVIISGLWGICFYGEMTGRPILFWLFWMCVCLAGVLGLSAEKE